MDLLHPRRQEIIKWLGTLDVYELTGKTHRELFDHSYPTWSRNGRAWDRRLATGGTYTMRAIIWYQHIYRPGSTDSRPAIILAAICEHLDSIASMDRTFKLVTREQHRQILDEIEANHRWPVQGRRIQYVHPSFDNRFSRYYRYAFDDHVITSVNRYVDGDPLVAADVDLFPEIMGWLKDGRTGVPAPLHPLPIDSD